MSASLGESGIRDASEVSKVEANNSKRAMIQKACQRGDVQTLISCSDEEGGLLDDECRKDAWPLLLGCSNNAAGDEWKQLPVHGDEEQVQKDVDRAFVYYPSNQSERSLDDKRKALSSLIVQTLRQYPMLHYFQGFHDIVQVFLLVLGEHASEAVARVSLFRVRDYMLESLDASTRQLHLIPAILKFADPELAGHMGGIPPYFALSAVLTLYAHDIEKYADIARLYDFILAHEPVMPIYLFAALIIQRRHTLLEFESTDHDMMLFTLSKLPQTLQLQDLIRQSLELFRQHPPEQLGRAWYNISSYSVLKTSRRQLRGQDLQQGQEYFEAQAREVERDKRRARIIKQVYAKRGRIVSAGVTVLVLGLSIYLRRSGQDRILWTSLARLTRLM